MKNRLLSAAFFLPLLFFLAGNAHAAGIPITGTAFGERIGLIHFDYKTAEKPDKLSAFDPSDPVYYIGPTRQFYADPYSLPFDKENPFVPGDPAVTASISVEPSDCTDAGCLLKGFVWSDTIGWIVLDGAIINESVSKAIGLDPKEEDSATDPYPSLMHPRIKTEPQANSRVALTGYAWNQYTGWIRLSSDDSGQTGVVTDASSQTAGDWGVWLGAGEPLIKVVTDPGPPLTEKKLGRRLHGNAWSERLGWIKFSRETDDTSDFDFGALTLWSPDQEPPVLLSPPTVWFAPGVNTGNPLPTPPSTIAWSQFAADVHSGINEDTTEFFIEPAPDTDPACAAFAPVPQSVGKTTFSFPPDYPAPPAVLNQLSGELLNLNIPTLGNVKGVAAGYCKYLLHAKITDLTLNTLYVGDHFSASPPPVPPAPPVNVFIRAGHVSAANSTVTRQSPDAAIADGKESVKYRVQLQDLVGNPVVGFSCADQYEGCPGREVSVSALVENNLVYDLTQVAPPPLPYLSPVRFSDTDVASLGDDLLALSDPTTNPEFLGDRQWRLPVRKVFSDYLIELASFAPSRGFLTSSKTTASHPLYIRSFDFSVSNDPLPATSRYISALSPLSLTDNADSARAACNEPGPDPTCDNPDILPSPNPNLLTAGQLDLQTVKCDSSAVGPFFACPSFLPPVVTGNASMASGDLGDTLSPGVPATLKFDVSNLSSKSIASADGGGLSIDNVFQFYSPVGNPLVALMEIQRIFSPSDPETPTEHLTWSDPFEACDFCTRYELFDGDHSAESGLGPITAENSPFHDFFRRFHPSYPFSFDFGLPSEPPTTSPGGIRADGTYAITGREGIPKAFDPLDPLGDPSDPTNYPEGEIDRNDPASLALSAGSLSSPFVLPSPKTVQFTPEKFLPETLSDIKFQILHEIAYRFPDQKIFTVYAGEDELLTNVDVKDLGVEAIGTVAGQSLVTGRQFDIVGTVSVRRLQEQLRRNVADLTLGLSPCPVKKLAAFETDGPCVFRDPVNRSLFAFYEGLPSDELVLGDNDDLTPPDLPYTIIVKGGANVFLRRNILSAPNGSFGLIVLRDQAGEGGNVFIAPAPTNISAILYADGSLLSKNDTGALFYGVGGADTRELSNQLYWQGSIASRNTIGGAGKEETPELAACLDGDTRLSCAQRYDLDYLRRFTVASTKDEFGNPVSTAIGGNGQFSGGGTCSGGTCSLGALPTLITLTGASFGLIDEPRSELAPFFLKKDPKTDSLPPPGFALPRGLESVQEIR